MTLQEMKKKVLRLIEEISDNNQALTDDPDIANKINDVINQIQFELCRIKKIPEQMEYELNGTNNVLNFKDIPSIYQLNKVEGCFYVVNDNEITFDEEFKGKVKIYYYKYPERITDSTNDNEYKFELSDDVLEIMPYGIAADILKSDVSTNYGITYSNRYNELKQTLDMRYANQIFYFDGGVEV